MAPGDSALDELLVVEVTELLLHHPHPPSAPRRFNLLPPTLSHTSSQLRSPPTLTRIAHRRSRKKSTHSHTANSQGARSFRRGCRRRRRQTWRSPTACCAQHRAAHKSAPIQHKKAAR
eukprot:1831478-Rhodomonas_salina.2